MAKWDKPGTGPGLGGNGGQVQQTGGETPAVPFSPLVGSDPGGTGVMGETNVGIGVYGRSLYSSDPYYATHMSGDSDGVRGESGGYGVHGISHGPAGVGVLGEAKGGGCGVWGQGYGTGPGVKGTSNIGPGLYAAGTPAAHFDGDIEITGNLNIASGGDVILNDCAEHFDVVDAEAEPGTVMVIDQNGSLRPSDHPYDKKVAGVVSGAGNFRPGIVLGKRQSQDTGMLIALLGKVYCKVDAQYSPIEVGDLLTTSSTPGYAMKAGDPFRAFGCVIGKALRSLEAGQELIPILVALQ